MEHKQQKTISNRAAAVKAAEKVDKLLFFILANSPDDEEWKEIMWADSNYFISNKGRVISLCNREPIFLKQFLCNGYYCVSICGYDRRIHRLVAKAFIENPEDKPIAHHKNHDKKVNTIDNLAWATYSENTTAYYENKRERESQEQKEPAAG